MLFAVPAHPSKIAIVAVSKEDPVAVEVVGAYQVKEKPECWVRRNLWYMSVRSVKPYFQPY
jgi:hypothetical protein